MFCPSLTVYERDIGNSYFFIYCHPLIKLGRPDNKVVVYDQISLLYSYSHEIINSREAPAHCLYSHHAATNGT